MQGFALLDVRKLYLDEMLEYYKHILYYLEKKGELKAGTYEKAKNVNSTESTVNQLRKQIFKAKSNG